MVEEAGPRGVFGVPKTLSCEAVEPTPPTPPALLLVLPEGVGRGAVLEWARVSVAGTNDAVLRKRGLTFCGWVVGVGRTEDIQQALRR